MTTPADPAASLHAAYAAAQDQLNQIYRTAAQGDGQKRTAAQRRTWLLVLLAVALRVVDRLDEAAHTYAQVVVAEQLAAGARAMDPTWEWDDDATRVATALANDSYADLASANDTVRGGIKRLFRDLSRQVISDVETRAGAIMLAEQQSAAGFARVLYRNGARFPLDAYVRMAVNTKLRVAVNSGAVHAANRAGVTYLEVIDGPECGWTMHDDPDLADGTVRPIEDCWAYPIAHPNCVRTFGARIDVTNPQEAADATPTAQDAAGEPAAVADVPVAAGRSPSWSRRASTAAAAGAAASAMSQRRAARQHARKRRTQR